MKIGFIGYGSGIEKRFGDTNNGEDEDMNITVNVNCAGGSTSSQMIQVSKIISMVNNQITYNINDILLEPTMPIVAFVNGISTNYTLNGQFITLTDYVSDPNIIQDGWELKVYYWIRQTTTTDTKTPISESFYPTINNQITISNEPLNVDDIEISINGMDIAKQHYTYNNKVITFNANLIGYDITSEDLVIVKYYI